MITLATIDGLIFLAVSFSRYCHLLLNSYLAPHSVFLSLPDILSATQYSGISTKTLFSLLSPNTSAVLDGVANVIFPVFPPVLNTFCSVVGTSPGLLGTTVPSGAIL